MSEYIEPEMGTSGSLYHVRDLLRSYFAHTLEPRKAVEEVRKAVAGPFIELAPSRTDPTFTSLILERTNGKPYHLTKAGAHYPVEVWTNGNIIIHHPCPVCGMESGVGSYNDWHDNVCSGRFMTEYDIA